MTDDFEPVRANVTFLAVEGFRPRGPLPAAEVLDAIGDSGAQTMALPGVVEILSVRQQWKVQYINGQLGVTDQSNTLPREELATLSARLLDTFFPPNG